MKKYLWIALIAVIALWLANKLGVLSVIMPPVSVAKKEAEIFYV